MGKNDWYTVHDTDTVVSTALLVYPDRIAQNIQTMLNMSQGADWLRPHVKTHKMAEIIQMQLDHGISKFKCATIAEAELLAETGARDILLAMQPLGPNIDRFFELIRAYPASDFSTLVDNAKTMQEIAAMAEAENTKAALWLDVNNGMNRTGILPDATAVALYQAIDENPNLLARGLHAYDGHIRDTDLAMRKQRCDAAFEKVQKLKAEIEATGVKVDGLVAGGSPTFPIHCKRPNVEASPGTTLLWDHNYGSSLPDMEFLPAGILMTRVISKPEKGYLCLDLGHKSVAPEMPLPRVHFLNANGLEQVGQSEEHLVVTTPNDGQFQVGDVLYAIPNHICPTVAKYGEVTAVENHKTVGTWSVAARNHKISI